MLDAVGDAFARIRAADAILSQGDAPALRIVASYSFAVLWLSPRLSRFQGRHPNVKLYLEPSHLPLDQTQTDVTILHAASPPEKAGWVMLFADRCAAMARAEHPFFETPTTDLAQVLRSRLVHVSHGKGPAWGEFSWPQWAKALGLPLNPGLTGPTVTAEHMAVELVLAEDAFALVSQVNTSHLAGLGRLRAAEASEVATGCSYWLRLRSKDVQTGKAATDFLNWIKGELANEQGASPGSVANFGS